VNVAPALDAWESVWTHLPFSGICSRSHRQPQTVIKCASGMYGRSWREIRETWRKSIESRHCISTVGSGQCGGSACACALLSESRGARYNRAPARHRNGSPLAG